MGALGKAEAALGPSKPTGSCDGAWLCSPARKENRSQSRGRTTGPPSSDFPGWDLPPATQTLPGRGNPSQPSSRKICSALPSSLQVNPASLAAITAALGRAEPAGLRQRSAILAIKGSPELLTHLPAPRTPFGDGPGPSHLQGGVSIPASVCPSGCSVKLQVLQSSRS